MVRQNHSDDAADEQTATSRFAAIREADALVPEHVSRVASYRGLEVTDAKYEDGQAVLLLEPADTERFPRRDA